MLTLQLAAAHGLLPVSHSRCSSAACLLMQCSRQSRANAPHCAHLGLGGGAVLVGAADVDAAVAAGACEARVAVGAEHAAHNVAQVGHVVHVWQRAGDQDVALACAQLGVVW